MDGIMKRHRELCDTLLILLAISALRLLAFSSESLEVETLEPEPPGVSAS